MTMIDEKELTVEQRMSTVGMMSTKPDMLFDQIRQAIRESGLTQYTICKYCAIDRGLFSRFLSGRSGLGPTNLEAVADLIGLRVVRDPAAATLTPDMVEAETEVSAVGEGMVAAAEKAAVEGTEAEAAVGTAAEAVAEGKEVSAEEMAAAVGISVAAAEISVVLAVLDMAGREDTAGLADSTAGSKVYMAGMDYTVCKGGRGDMDLVSEDRGDPTSCRCKAVRDGSSIYYIVRNSRIFPWTRGHPTGNTSWVIPLKRYRALKPLYIKALTSVYHSLLPK